jgi:hypothetical protein
VWQARMTDNVNTINGFTYQNIYQNRILPDANSFIAQGHPGGDGHWEGYTDPGCLPADDQSWNPGTGGTPYGRGNGAWMMRSAFVYLLTGNAAYADPVRTELLQQITESGTEWSNTGKFCLATLGGGNLLEIFPWVNKLLLSFDYLNAGGYVWGAGEYDDILQWFVDAAVYSSSSSISRIVETQYPGVYDDPQDFTLSGGAGSPYAITHFGGHDIYPPTQYWANRGQIHTATAMAVGIIASNASLIDFAVKATKAYITLGMFDDGTVEDFSRWVDCDPPCPGSMWGHTAGATGGLISVADMYARTGNTELYDFLTATQVIGGSGGNVGLETLLNLFAELAIGDTVLYADATTDHPLYWVNALGHDFYHDFSSMVANMYYRNPTISAAMERPMYGTSGSDAGDCYDSQISGCWSGISFLYPDLPFMFGNMEDNPANPFLDEEPPEEPSPQGGARGAQKRVIYV